MYAQSFYATRKKKYLLATRYSRGLNTRYRDNYECKGIWQLVDVHELGLCSVSRRNSAFKYTVRYPCTLTGF
jgi:hypothetical protein